VVDNDQSLDITALTGSSMMATIISEAVTCIPPVHRVASLISELNWELLFTSVFKKEEGKNMVEILDNDVGKKISEKLRHWLANITERIRSENLQYLKQTIVGSARGLRPLDRGSSVVTYANTMYRVFCCLYRVVMEGMHADYFSSFNDVQNQFLTFIENIESADDSSMVDLLVILLFQRLELCAPRNAFLIAKMVAFLSLDDHQQWLSENLMRKPVSHFMYWINCLYYFKTTECNDDRFKIFISQDEHTLAKVMADFSALIKSYDNNKPVTQYIKWGLNSDNTLNYQHILLRNGQLHLSAFREMFGTYMSRLSSLMKELLLKRQRSNFSAANIMDEIGNKVPGYSFLTDARNSFFFEAEKDFKQQFYQETSARNRLTWVAKCNDFWIIAIPLIRSVGFI
jgi:hypothetical protein